MTKKYVIALGFFDGVHLGHAGLMERVVEISKEKGYVPAVVTFDTHPFSKITGKDIPLISSPEDRAGIIRRKFGIKEVVFLRFDDELMHMHWTDFADNLINNFNPAHFVCGHDYSFGYKGEGEAEMLKELCKERGIGCDIVPPVKMDGIRISSTLIRDYILEGDMEEANRHLGHAHVLTDIVRSGRKLGRTINAPTINMQFARGVIVPKHGVYATKVILDDGSIYRGVTNVGVRPTVENAGNVNAETYILNYSGNLYGRSVRIEFYKFIRPEMKFADVHELKAQIKQDALSVEAYFDNLE